MGGGGHPALRGPPLDPAEELELHTASEAETEAVGDRLAQCLEPGTVVALTGDLGSGKTVLCRGVIRGLGNREEYVTSPTFTIVNPYEGGRLPLWHLDLYRLSGADELEAIGAEEWFAGNGVVLVEWPERGQWLIPGDRLEVELGFEAGRPEGRRVCLRARGARSRAVLEAYRRGCGAG